MCVLVHYEHTYAKGEHFLEVREFFSCSLKGCLKGLGVLKKKKNTAEMEEVGVLGDVGSAE